MPRRKSSVRTAGRTPAPRAQPSAGLGCRAQRHSCRLAGRHAVRHRRARTARAKPLPLPNSSTDCARSRPRPRSSAEEFARIWRDSRPLKPSWPGSKHANRHAGRSRPAPQVERSTPESSPPRPRTCNNSLRPCCRSANAAPSVRKPRRQKKRQEAALLKPRTRLWRQSRPTAISLARPDIRKYGVDDGFGGKTRDFRRHPRRCPGRHPADAHVEFAGPFRSYGQLLILDTGDGYHVLLAGLGEITYWHGTVCGAGEPVGLMGATAAPGTLTGDQVQEGGPVLYIEFRKDGESDRFLAVVGRRFRASPRIGKGR